MDVPCAACLNLPTGIDGHDDLRVHGMGNAQMSFECRTCGSLWSRMPKSGTAAFAWFGLNDLPRPRTALGIPVPPRSTPAPVFKWWPRDAPGTPGKADR